ncbi:MAG: histidine phosphatase family protein [Gammaproteobacteria bacterium]|nr:histidine phosphatase family protein [Gammaproteobacteria bacterium]
MKYRSYLSVLLLILSPIVIPDKSFALQLDEPFALDTDELRQLIPSLQKGGYVIFFRHMTTDHNQEDRRPVNLSDCKTQRPLSAKGRQQASTIGKIFQTRKIPVGKVISSPFCRCKQTAKLAFKRFTLSDDLYFAMGLDRAGKQAKGEVLRKMLRQQPAKGKNTIIVAHTANLQEAVGLWPKPEGVAYIFKSGTNGNIKLVAMVKPQTWNSL